jgi:hypothetical protein
LEGTGTAVLEGITGVACGIGAGAGAVRTFPSGTPIDAAKFRTAAWNASALWNRCSGSLEMAIKMMSFKSSGTPAMISMGATGFCCRCAAMIE